MPQSIRVSGKEAFKMDMVEWNFLMGLPKKVILRITFLKEESHLIKEVLPDQNKIRKFLN
jgi:hypothetical protein